MFRARRWLAGIAIYVKSQQRRYRRFGFDPSGANLQAVCSVKVSNLTGKRRLAQNPRTNAEPVKFTVKQYW